MQYNTIYEIPVNPFPKDIVLNGAITIIAILIILGSIALMIKEKRLDKFFIILILVSGIAVCFFLPIFLECLDHGGSEEGIYAKQYYAGHYKVIEGEVSTLEGEYSEVEFSVGNIQFNGGGSWPVGFTNSKGQINSNGQKVKIYHIPDRSAGYLRNIIIRLDLKTK